MCIDGDKNELPIEKELERLVDEAEEEEGESEDIDQHSLSGDENSSQNQVFSLLWHEYCDIKYESGIFSIFQKPSKIKSLPRLDFSFEFTDLDDSDVILKDPKDAMELWSHYYMLLDKEDLMEKYIPQVKKYFERNDITKHGCFPIPQKRALPPIVIKENFELPKVNDEVKYPINISNKLKYEIDDKQFVAVEEIAEGEPIIIEKPLIICVPPSCHCIDSIYFQCYQCRRPIIRSYNCTTCFIAVYCSIECREASEMYHKWECKAVKTHFFRCNDVTLLAFRMLMVGANCNFNTSEEYYAMINNLPANIDLFSNKQKKQLVRKTLQMLIYLTNHTNFYKWMDQNSILMDFHGIDNKNIFLGGTLIRHLIQAITNVVYFPCEDYSFFFPTKGAVFSVPTISPTVVKLKQDCQPNSKLVFKRNYCVVKALRNIQEGETITVNFYQCDECEVHNTKKMYFYERKMVCRCRTCRQPYNEMYGEVLLRCKYCNGISGRVGEQWQCFQCKNLLNMYYMDSRKKVMESKFMAIQRNRFFDLDTMIEFMHEYPTIYCEVSREYLEVAAQCCKKLLYQSKYVCLMNILDDFVELINLRYHKYSFLKLHVIIKIVNCILVYSRVIDPTTRVASLLYTCSKEVEDVSKFHCLSSEWQMLHKMVWNIGFIAMKPTEEEILKLKAMAGGMLTDEEEIEADRAYGRKLEENENLMSAQAGSSQGLMDEIDCNLVAFWTGIQYDLLPPDA